VVVDRLFGRGAHHVELRWPFASPRACTRRLSAGEVAAFARLGRAARLRRPIDPAHAVEVPLGAAGRLLLAFACPPGLAPAIEPSLRSPGYGRVEEASAAVVAGTVSCPATLVTLLLHLPAGSAAP
jgi:hypothetical protein